MEPNNPPHRPRAFRPRRFVKPGLLALAVSGLTVLAGCDGAGDLTDTPAPGELTVRFAVTPAPPRSFSASSEASLPTGVSVRVEDGALVLEGTNGTLELTGIWMVVKEFELEGEGQTEDFESGPFFVELGLDEVTVDIHSGPVPAGQYEELDFEVDELGGDEDLFVEVRERFPEWPENASIRVTGTFTPSFDTQPRTFEVFLEGQVEVELEFSPPLVMNEMEGEVAVVNVAPGLWFARGDGSVVELSRWDHRFGDRDLQELEVEIENGFLKVEWDG